jgi:hypothetical protein
MIVILSIVKQSLTSDIIRIIKSKEDMDELCGTYEKGKKFI